MIPQEMYTIALQGMHAAILLKRFIVLNLMVLMLAQMGNLSTLRKDSTIRSLS